MSIPSGWIGRRGPQMPGAASNLRHAQTAQKRYEVCRLNRD